MTQAASPSAAFSRPSPRWRLLAMLGGGAGALALVWGGWWLLFSAHEVETDNAYVGADVAQVTPLVSGQVGRVLVGETQAVKVGQPLVQLDPADALIAQAQARAALAQARRQVQGMFANDKALAAQSASRGAAIAEADARMAAARADLDRARIDLDRRKALAGSGAVSGDELTTAEDRFATAKAALASAEAARVAAMANRTAAEGARAVNQAMIAGADIDNNPDVQAAKAKLDAADLALSRTTIVSPIEGVVARKSVQVGQMVSPGAPVMAVVPLKDVFVDANFKEVQLERVRLGQPVRLTSDLYGSGVVYHGRVKGLGGGTGSAFALIPSQNATGNWIKIVQRLPVRIQLDPADVEKHPLRVGLSMKVKIDVAEPGK